MFLVLLHYERPLDDSPHPREILKHARGIVSGAEHTCAVLHAPRTVNASCDGLDVNADADQLFTRSRISRMSWTRLLRRAVIGKSFSTS